MAEHATTVDHVRIVVHELAGHAGGRRPLLIVHASGFHGRAYAPLAAGLSAHYRCLAPDLRGHGMSDLPPGLDFSWRGFARDIAAVVDGLGLEGPVGVGHSLGGAALLLAEEARPGTFSSLYCYEPIVLAAIGPLAPGNTGPPAPPPENSLSTAARRRREVFASRREAYDNYVSKPPLDVLDPASLRAYVDYGFEDRDDGTVALRCKPDSEARTFAGGYSHDAFRHLGGIRCPVVLACGSETDAVGPDSLQQLTGRLCDATVEVIPELGHFGPLEDPFAVAESVLRTIVTSPA